MKNLAPSRLFTLSANVGAVRRIRTLGGATASLLEPEAPSIRMPISKLRSFGGFGFGSRPPPAGATTALVQTRGRDEEEGGAGKSNPVALPPAPSLSGISRLLSLNASSAFMSARVEPVAKPASRGSELWAKFTTRDCELRKGGVRLTRAVSGVTPKKHHP